MPLLDEDTQSDDDTQNKLKREVRVKENGDEASQEEVFFSLRW